MPTLSIHTHWQVAQSRPSSQNLPKSMAAPSHGRKESTGIQHCIKAIAGKVVNSRYVHLINFCGGGQVIASKFATALILNRCVQFEKMTNSEKFLDTYNKIDNYLKKIDSYDSYVNFAQKVRNSNNRVVLRFKDELLSFGELRNAIVHNPKIGNKAIAEPHERTVLRISELYEIITNPKKVIPEFQFEVLGAKIDDFINDILIEMKKKSFSQFPVYDENGFVCELVNNNTISRWLSSQLEENGTIINENVKVANLMVEIEFKENYKFVSRSTSIYEAYHLFINQINKEQRNLDVIFITQNGKPNEKLVGLITIEDIAKLI